MSLLILTDLNRAILMIHEIAETQERKSHFSYPKLTTLLDNLLTCTYEVHDMVYDAIEQAYLSLLNDDYWETIQYLNIGIIILHEENKTTQMMNKRLIKPDTCANDLGALSIIPLDIRMTISGLL